MSRGKDSVELTIMSDPARIQSVLDSLSGIHTICWKGDTGDSCDISVEFTGDSKKSAGRFPLLLQEKKSRSHGFIFPGRI